MNKGRSGYFPMWSSFPWFSLVFSFAYKGRTDFMEKQENVSEKKGTKCSIAIPTH